MENEALMRKSRKQFVQISRIILYMWYTGHLGSVGTEPTGHHESNNEFLKFSS